VPLFAQQGCWLTCHQGERDMPSSSPKEEVQANALFTAIKKNDVRKYLPASRNDPSDWKSGKSVEDINKIKAEGGFVDLIQWRAQPLAPGRHGDDGYVLEWRNFDAGSNMFGGNADNKTHQPKLMWDAKKVGYKSITATSCARASISSSASRTPCRSTPCGVERGRHDSGLLSSAATTPRARPRQQRDRQLEERHVDRRARPPARPRQRDDKSLKKGGVYNVGFAVHDDNITTRGHHVSFNKTLVSAPRPISRAVKLP